MELRTEAAGLWARAEHFASSPFRAAFPNLVWRFSEAAPIFPQMQDSEARGSFVTQADWSGELSLSPAGLPGLRPGGGLGARLPERPGAPPGASQLGRAQLFLGGSAARESGVGRCRGTQEDQSQRERQTGAGRGPAALLNDSPLAVPIQTGRGTRSDAVHDDSRQVSARFECPSSFCS